MFDVIAIGSATRDNFFIGDYELIKWEKTPSGKAYVLPYAEKLDVKDAHFTIGGNSVNASVTFSRQGLKAALAAKLGDDLSAQELKKRLETEGVSTELVAHTKERHTAFSVLISEKGDRTILGYHGASDTFVLEDLDLSKLGAPWWYLSLAGESDKMLLPLMAHAKKEGIKVAFNPSGHHIHHKKEEILSSLKDIDVLLVNEGEAAALMGISFEEESRVFKKLDELLSPGIVAVTNGERGVTVSDGKKIYKAGIFKENEVKDRTGAGDAFGSGFVSVLIRGGSIEEAIRFASANATSVIEQIGATEGILSKKEFDASSRWKNLDITVKEL